MLKREKERWRETGKGKNQTVENTKKNCLVAKYNFNISVKVKKKNIYTCYVLKLEI